MLLSYAMHCNVHEGAWFIKRILNSYYRAMHYRLIVQSAVLRLHVVRLTVCPSVCNVGGSGIHRLEILETNCTDK